MWQGMISRNRIRTMTWEKKLSTWPRCTSPWLTMRRRSWESISRMLKYRRDLLISPLLLWPIWWMTRQTEKEFRPLPQWESSKSIIKRKMCSNWILMPPSSKNWTRSLRYDIFYRRNNQTPTVPNSSRTCTMPHLFIQDTLLRTHCISHITFSSWSTLL